MTLTLSILIALLEVFMAVVGVAVGIYLERKRWNDLIREGKLPKPGQRWNRC